jgi:multiple sugar transport system substrate-binding protein
VPSGAKLPTDKVTLRWLDGAPAPRTTFLKAFFAEYQKVHPNITLQVDYLPNNQISQVLPLGIQNGNAYDCFPQPGSVTAGQMVHEGWVQPLDDVIPNFAEWKARYPAGTLVEGLSMFGGKVYSCPYLSNRQHGTLTLFNVQYLQAAGYNPSATPISWDDLRAAAKKVTAQGKGQYYGYIIGGGQTNRWSDVVTNLAELAGTNVGTTPAGNIDWKTGEFAYTTDQVLGAIDLLLALKADGSVFPGSVQLDGPAERDQFAKGVAGIILQGPWNIQPWESDYPKFDFGIGGTPVPNSGAVGKLHYGPGSSWAVWVYAKTKLPEVAGDLLYNLPSPANQQALITLTGGFPPPLLLPPGPVRGASPRIAKAYELIDLQMRLGPAVEARNPDVGQVLLELKTAKPDFGQIIQGLYTGQVRDAKAALQDLQDRSDKALDQAIKAAQAKGANVSRDDWKFPNWDPTQDYTQADYDALK